MGVEAFLQKEPKIPGAHKVGAAISGPRIADRKITDMRLTFSQRAANRGSDPSWLNLAFLGRPDFQSRGPQIPIFKGFGTSGRKIGAPQKRQIQPRRIQRPICGPHLLLQKSPGQSVLLESLIPAMLSGL